MHSNLSLQVAGVWTLLWKGISVTPKRVEELNDPKSKELLEVNITEFDGNYLELFKYVAKFDEITSYAVWKDLYVGLKGKRKYATSVADTLLRSTCCKTSYNSDSTGATTTDSFSSAKTLIKLKFDIKTVIAKI